MPCEGHRHQPVKRTEKINRAGHKPYAKSPPAALSEAAKQNQARRHPSRARHRHRGKCQAEQKPGWVSSVCTTVSLSGESSCAMVVVPSPQEAKADLGSRIKRVGVHALTDGHRGNDFAAGAVHHRHCFAAAIAEEQPVVFQINRHAGNFFPQAKPKLHWPFRLFSRYALARMKSPFKLRSGLTFLASLSVIVLLAGCKTGSAPARDVSHYPADAATVLPGKGPLQTWTGFTNVWAERHAAWQRDTNNETGAVVFLGDSITQGWNSLAKVFPDFKVVNRGIGGDTTRGVLYRLNADVLALKPTAVVLLIGINDIGLNAEPAGRGGQHQGHSPGPEAIQPPDAGHRLQSDAEQRKAAPAGRQDRTTQCAGG